MLKSILLNSFPWNFVWTSLSLSLSLSLSIYLSISLWLPQPRGLIPAVSAAIQTLAVIGWTVEVAQYHSTANKDATEPVAHEIKSLNLIFLLSFSPSAVICFQMGAVITQISPGCVNPPHMTTLRSHRLVTDAHTSWLYIRFWFSSSSSFFVLSVFGLFRNSMSCTVKWALRFSCVRSAPKTIKM